MKKRDLHTRIHRFLRQSYIKCTLIKRFKNIIIVDVETFIFCTCIALAHKFIFFFRSLSLFITVIAMIVAQINAAQQQKFKATPHDLQVLEGSEAVLRCEVSNLAGQVQWTKDGFALGRF